MINNLSTIIEEIQEDICDNYCKYRDTCDDNNECKIIREGKECPLDKYYYPWILCNKQLPEEKENPITHDYYTYPVVFRNKEITDIRFYAFGKGHWWHGPQIMDGHVTHWMDIYNELERKEDE